MPLVPPSAKTSGLIFALHAYKEKVKESSIANFLYITATTTCGLRTWRVVTKTEHAEQLLDFVMTELLGTHSLLRAVNRRLSDWSVVHSRLNLSPDWLIVRTRWSKPIKTYCKRPYRLYSFLTDRDLDSARLKTASLSSAPYIIYILIGIILTHKHVKYENEILQNNIELLWNEIWNNSKCEIFSLKLWIQFLK